MMDLSNRYALDLTLQSVNIKESVETSIEDKDQNWKKTAASLLNTAERTTVFSLENLSIGKLL